MKTFLKKWIGCYAVLALFVAYYMVNVNGNVTGDLGMLARMPFTVDYDLQTRAYDYTDSLLMYELIDVDSAGNYPLLFIGDSYSNPKFALSTCLSRAMGDTVRVVCDAINDFYPVKVFIYGLNNNCFRSGQIIILESIERYLVSRFTQIDLTDSIRPEGLLTSEAWNPVEVTELRNLSQRRITGKSEETFNFKDFLRWLQIKMWPRTSVKHFKLDRTLFCHKEYGNDLFFYKQDYNSCDVPQEQLQEIANNLNRLFETAEAQGIHLYFVITPDKYDLYYPYIVNPQRTRPNIIDFLADVNPRFTHRIINTRDSLASYLERGDMDVIRCNESHWSVATSEAMGQVIGKHILRDITQTSHVSQTGAPD